MLRKFRELEMLITDGLFREKQGGYPVPSFRLSKQLSSATAPENRTKCWQKATNSEEKGRKWYSVLQKAKNESKQTSLSTSDNTH